MAIALSGSWRSALTLRPGQGVVLTSSTAATHDISDMLRHYPKGLLATPLQVRDARFAFRYGSGASVNVSKALSGFSAPATGGASITSTRFSMRMP